MDPTKPRSISENITRLQRIVGNGGEGELRLSPGQVTEDRIAAERRAFQGSLDAWHVRPPGIDGTPVLGGPGETADGGASDDFRAFMKTGETRAALVAGTGANGGFIVPEALHAPVAEKYRKISAIIGLATKFDLEGGNTSMYLPYKSAHGVVASTTETGARTEQTEPTFSGGAGSALTCYDYYTDQRTTQTWLDAVPNGEQMMLEWVLGDFYEQLGVDVAVGNGTTKASGLFAATAFYGTMLSGSAGAVTNTSILALYTAVQPKYRVNGAWIMNSATFGVCLAFAYPNTQTPLVQWVDGHPFMLGKPILEDSNAPAIGAANYPIAFGDVSQGYAIGVHKQTTVLRDPFTDKPRVIFYGLARMGGVPWDPNAIVLLKSNNS